MPPLNTPLLVPFTFLPCQVSFPPPSSSLISPFSIPFIVSLSCLGIPSPNPARESGDAVSSPAGPLKPSWRTVPDVFCVEIHTPCNNSLQKFSDYQVCIVIRIGTATYWYSISQKTSGGMVSSRTRMCYCGISSHFQLWALTVHALVPYEIDGYKL